jgi:hypothetical protein
MDPLLKESKDAVVDHLASLPAANMAEEADFVVWGKEFCRLLVSNSLSDCDSYSYRYVE